MLQAIKERIRDLIEKSRARRITLEDARQRATRGAAYLDEAVPGWYRRIDGSLLDMGDGRSCILGQLYGSFAAGLRESGLINPATAPRTIISPIYLGLLAIQRVCEALQEQDYENLNQAWQEAVEMRRRLYRLTVMPPFIELSVREPVSVN